MAELHVTETAQQPPSRRAYLAFALVCAASAAFVFWIAATHDAGLRVPPAIAYVVAFVFAATAARLLQLRNDSASEGNGFAFLFCGAMAIIGGWIAFGAGPRACTAGMGAGEAVATSGLACRIPFGIGAAISAAFALYCLLRFVSARRSLRR